MGTHLNEIRGLDWKAMYPECKALQNEMSGIGLCCDELGLFSLTAWKALK